MNVRAPFAVANLKDREVSAEYEEKLKQQLADKDKWSEVAQAIKEVSTDVLGPKGKVGKDPETPEQSQRRKNLHKQAKNKSSTAENF